MTHYMYSFLSVKVENSSNEFTAYRHLKKTREIKENLKKNGNFICDDETKLNELKARSYAKNVGVKLF